jgi:aminoglycoside 3-N-acetyltransferase
MSIVTELARQWRSCGVEPGDTLLLHSNIQRTIRAARKAGHVLTVRDVLDSFLEAIEPAGTLLLPLFNFDFTRGTPFDIRHTPSQMGALTEAGREYPGSVRTGHPVYSFAAIGARAALFDGMDNRSAFADDSPFGLLRRLEGRVAALDLDDHDSMTFYHHVEEMKRVPYRFFKDFHGTYIDREGQTSERTYTIYVRDLERNVVTEGNPAAELMWSAGVYRGDRPKTGSGLRTVAAVQMFEFLARLIDEGRALGTMYSIGTAE